ncbi:MarR family transcriptional regulator [Cohnella terricola]|uniref:MarR family transcriptional regulator n=1 Tax=Cohnella terricola TaxID=1289167 RepID=A0A559JDR7_9BACL|nr:helix-turn-helix domain-containing protein [Cohnella terricola]TVX98013.1 MarR family transcriptional regulator [Cohnella terricola]
MALKSVNNEVRMTGELKQAYELWLNKLVATSRGERKRRLTSTTNHAEQMFIVKVWWPAFGHFACLQAEHEVRDFKDGTRYLDFAYITEGFKICIEIDGFGAHWRDVNRTQFADQLMRQNHLVIDGWYVLRFSYDDIMDRPRMCQQIIQHLLGRLGAQLDIEIELTLTEQAILQLALSIAEPLSPKFVVQQLGIHRTTVHRHLQCLVSKKLLIPVRTDVKRICGYKANKANLPDFRT